MSTAMMEATGVAEDELSVAEEELSARVAADVDLAEFEIEFEQEADREIRACLAQPYVTYVP